MNTSSVAPPFNLLLAGSDLGAAHRGNPAHISAAQRKAFDFTFSLTPIYQITPKEVAASLVPPPDAPLLFPDSLPQEICAHLQWYEDVQHTCTTLLQTNLPLVIIGGDHGISTASLAAASSFVCSQEHEPCLLWLDAHFDLHTPQSSHSKNWHGMPFANVLGFSNHPASTKSFEAKNVMHFGARSFEPEELSHVQQLGIVSATCSATKGSQANFSLCIQRALQGFFYSIEHYVQQKGVLSNGCAPYCISFDLDLLDPAHFEATSLPEPSLPSSLAPAPMHLLEVFDYFFVQRKIPPPVSFEIMEYNPLKDSSPYAFSFFKTLLDTIYVSRQHLL